VAEVYLNPLYILFVGIWLRYFAMTIGNMEDYNNFNDASLLFLDKKNIYLDAPTFNWPYSTLFLQTLSWFQYLTQFASNLSFRFLFVTLLIVVDVGIFVLIKKLFGYNSAVFYFLNPISIIITGYHNQFDNFALLLAFAGIFLISSHNSHTQLNLKKKITLCALLIGVSISLKHIFIFLPIFLLFSRIGLKFKFRIFLISYFLPFVYFGVNFFTAPRAFIDQVLNYSSWANYPLLYWLDISGFNNYDSAKLLLLVVMLFGSIFTYKLNVKFIIPYYLLLLFTFTPAIANQQWIIPLLIASVLPNLFFYIWSILTSLALFADRQALNIDFFKNILPSTLVRNPDSNLDGYFNGVFRNLFLFYLIGVLLLIYRVIRKRVSS
jgi:hypothetical protein